MRSVVEPMQIWNILPCNHTSLFKHIHAQPLKSGQVVATSVDKDGLKLVQRTADWNVPSALQEEVASTPDNIEAWHITVFRK